MTRADRNGKVRSEKEVYLADRRWEVMRGTKKMVDDGLEPPTVALLVRYSTD